MLQDIIILTIQLIKYTSLYKAGNIILKHPNFRINRSFWLKHDRKKKKKHFNSFQFWIFPHLIGAVPLIWGSWGSWSLRLWTESSTASRPGLVFSKFAIYVFFLQLRMSGFCLFKKVQHVQNDSKCVCQTEG